MRNVTEDKAGLLPRTEGTPALEVRGLTKHFEQKAPLPWQRSALIRAVDGVDFAIQPGKTLGIVGESGCGKSTVARLIVRLETPNAGRVLVHGRDISHMSSSDKRLYRREVQMVFQDPYSSLNSRMTVEDCITEPLTVQHVGKRKERSEHAGYLMEKVGLDPSFGARFPSQMSGGQRQRVAIARALALSPSVIVADEPTSALDVSVRAQVINLLCDLQEQSNLAFAFISHDLATVRHIAHDIAVMYLGKVVESGPTEGLFEQPLHPYTRALLSAVPIPDPAAEAERPIELLTGDPPSPINPPSGCRFHTRCPLATEICREEEPALLSYGSGRMAACHHVDAAVAV